MKTLRRYVGRYLRQSGFTLIELLMVIAIVGILTAIATPSFLTWLNSRKVEDVYTQIEGAIKESQATAIQKGQVCTLKIEPTITSDPTNCLPTGPRDLSKLGMRVLAQNDSDVILGIANLGAPTPSITFSYKGTIHIDDAAAGIIVVYNPNTVSKQRCLVISSGIGMIRTGTYTGSTPNNPTDIGNCDTSK